MINPLLAYEFQQFPLNETLFPPDEDFKLPSYRETMRCPDPSTNQSNDGLADSYVGSINLSRQVVSRYYKASHSLNLKTDMTLLNKVSSIYSAEDI